MIILRNKKNQSNKRGAMLILVLLIVALAVILISSALTMTKSTRTHYYTYTKMSQAQLTVTSVAESIWDSIQIQAIDDDTVHAMADADAKVEFSGLDIPGMKGDPNSKAYAIFDLQTNGNVTIDCYAIVGGEQANVRMTLTPPDVVTKTNHFKHQINMAGDGCIGEFIVGKGGEGLKDNTMLLHGAMNSNLGSSDFYSTLITNKPFMPASGTTFHGDVVFWGPEAGWQHGNGAGLNFSSDTNNTVYFVSPSGTTQTALRGFGSNQNPINNVDNMVFYNSKWDYSGAEMWGQLMHVTNLSYETGSTFTTTVHPNFASDWPTYLNGQDSGIQSQLMNQAKDYVSSTNQAEFGATSLPTLSSQVDSFGVPTSPSGTTVTDFDDLNSHITDGAVTPGSYVIANGNLAGSVTLDLIKGNYTLYVQGDGTIAGLLNIINGAKGTDHWVNIILANGKTLTVTGAVSTVDAASGGKKPHLSIWGMGGCKINFPLDGSGGAVCQAYICLYDNPSDTPSEVVFRTGASCNFFGRIVCHFIRRTDGGDKITIPYCPDPTYDESNGKIVPIETGYKCQPFQYFV